MSDPSAIIEDESWPRGLKFTRKHPSPPTVAELRAELARVCPAFRRRVCIVRVLPPLTGDMADDPPMPKPAKRTSLDRHAARVLARARARRIARDLEKVA